MREATFLTHKGVRILYEDLENAHSEEVLPWIERAKVVIRSQPEKSVLALLNVKNAKFDTQVTSALKEFAKGNEPYVKVAAVYGIEGLKEIIFKSVLAFTGRKNLVLFKNLEEAKDFLANQA
ncbi:MAG: hypothetical protein CVU55_09775 [Deltaproteobacteria bacterium HGW-Deltaproteobacteria-13]|nr:MAG: hypothetical protein CVU55_09775 [Deltaproteobacteria bacterium HGW-Deltaproteobacteria-13]